MLIKLREQRSQNALFRPTMQLQAAHSAASARSSIRDSGSIRLHGSNLVIYEHFAVSAVSSQHLTATLFTDSCACTMYIHIMLCILI